MRNVTLVPESDIFQRGLSVGANHARQSAHLFQVDGIALVRHRRRALLLLAEELFRLADFGALQVTQFCRDTIQGGSDHGEHANVIGVTVASDDLRSNGRDIEAEAFADLYFEIGIEMSAIADRAREFADTHVFRRSFEAIDIT